nr:hypothetical protein [Clostridium sp. AF12-19]
MSNNSNTEKAQLNQQPTIQHRNDGGGAPGPKYTIPCPPPKKK